jgi:hypothetical protein
MSVPVDKFSIVIAAVSILAGATVWGMTMVWRLAHSLRDRPKNAELEKLEDRVSALEIEAAKRGVLIENIDKNVEKMDKNIEKLIEKLG